MNQPRRPLLKRCRRCGRLIKPIYSLCYLCYSRESGPTPIRKCGLCGKRTTIPEVPFYQTLCYECWKEKNAEEHEKRFRDYLAKQPKRNMPQTTEFNREEYKATFTRPERQRDLLEEYEEPEEEVEVKWIPLRKQ